MNGRREPFPFWNPPGPPTASRASAPLWDNDLMRNNLDEMCRFGTERVLEQDSQPDRMQKRERTSWKLHQEPLRAEAERNHPMQRTETATEPGRRRVEAVVETLAAMHRHGDSLAELAHDARNMVTALSLYCDLLEEPGVLAAPHHHYATELRLVAEGSRRLVEKLSLLDRIQSAGAVPGRIADRQGRLFTGYSENEPAANPADARLIDDLREEVLASQNLLAAIAGPAIRVTVSAEGGALPVAMTGENLIRVLVNLVRNSAEAIAGPGAIELTLKDRYDPGGAVRFVVLAVDDSGGGIPDQSRDKVFEPGFTTHAERPGRHRGLGLSITRSLVEAAGGRITAGNHQPHGARFLIELPVEERQGPREQGNKGTREQGTGIRD